MFYEEFFAKYVKNNLKFNEKITVPQNPAFFEKGKKIHALANYYHRGADISKLETALTDEEKIIWERLKHNEYFSKKCLHSEYPITARLEDIWIFGRLDAIVHDGADNAGSKSYWILDYKTGAIPKNPENDFQTMKNNENKVIEFTPQLKEIYEKTLKQKCRQILATKDFECKENRQHCKFCEYNKICR